MEHRIISLEISKEKFETLFKEKIPNNEYELEDGQIYGGIYNNKFTLAIKLPPRSFKNMFHDELVGFIDGSGNIHYRFRRTPLAVILTRILPLVLSLVCILACLTSDMYQSMLFIPLFAVMFACNFMHPLKHRGDLEGFLKDLSRGERY